MGGRGERKWDLGEDKELWMRCSGGWRRQAHWRQALRLVSDLHSHHVSHSHPCGGYQPREIFHLTYGDKNPAPPCSLSVCVDSVILLPICLSTLPFYVDIIMRYLL
jgi:hypothetical protein